MSSETIVGICGSYCYKFRSFQVTLTKEEYDRLKAKFPQKSDTYTSIDEYVKRDGETVYFARVKTPKDRYFTEESFNTAYAGLRARILTQVLNCDFISKDTRQAMKGTSFSMVSITPQ